MYYVIIGVVCCINGILICLIHENNRLQKSVKRNFILTALTIMIAALAECFSLVLNGAPAGSIRIHAALKCCDYLFSPLLAYYLVRLFDDNKILARITETLVFANVALEILSLFTGWTFYVDADNFYHHGPYYFIYTVVYILIYFCCLASFILYCRHFKKQNLLSLLLIFLIIIVGLVLQEVFSESFRISYLTLSVGAVFLFVHYSEFYQQKNDEYLTEQNKLLRTDALTGLLNRYAYIEALKKITDEPEDSLAVFSVDINGLKNVNDMYGHDAGDEMIIGAAETITKVLGAYGQCYRTGGDEFICIVKMPEDDVYPAKKKLMDCALMWKGKLQPNLALAVGYSRVVDYPGRTIHELVIISDKMMYREKDKFYEVHPDMRR